MTDLPATKKYKNHMALMFDAERNLPQFLLAPKAFADAMRDELLARIAELEAELKHAARSHTEMMEEATVQRQRAEQAEAALAEREARRCEDCSEYSREEEPCDRFSGEFLQFMREHCNETPVSCCFWRAQP